MFKNKLKAFLVHLTASALLVSIFCVLSIFVWCPPPLDTALGLRKVLLLLFVVDVVAGPFLTFVVFNPEKRSLRCDLAVIIFIQLTAFSYGAWTIFHGRPVYVVFAVDRFELTTASQIEDEELHKVTLPEFAKIPLWGPKLAFAKIPTEKKEQERVLFSSLAGADLNVFPQHFLNYAQEKSKVLAASRPVADLTNFNPDKTAVIQQLIERYKRVGIDLRYVPIAGRKQDETALLNAASGEVLDFVPLVPW